jgi:hypothetical protein
LHRRDGRHLSGVTGSEQASQRDKPAVSAVASRGSNAVVGRSEGGTTSIVGVALTTSTALDALRQRLDAVGFAVESPDLALLWSVVRDWGREPVADVDAQQGGDQLLFEGVLFDDPPSRWSRGRRFVLGFTRQFAFEDVDDVQQERQSVSISVEYALLDDFRVIATMRSASYGSADQIYGIGGPGAEEWIKLVEASDSYRVALRHSPPAAVRFTYGPI